jgi:hypothetical protein
MTEAMVMIGDDCRSVSGKSIRYASRVMTKAKSPRPGNATISKQLLTGRILGWMNRISSQCVDNVTSRSKLKNYAKRTGYGC